MTACELYDQSDAFRSFLDHWDADRRCPYGLADWLTDHYPDMIGPAKCAQWCATQPDRNVLLPQGNERRTPCGPYPTLGNGWFFSFMNEVDFACDVPKDCLDSDESNNGHNETPVDAILALMDVWNPEAEL